MAVAEILPTDGVPVEDQPQRAVMLNSQRQFLDSAQVLEEGLRRSPGSWQFYYQLGVAHFGLGQYAEAESEYLKVLALNSSPPAEFRVKLADVYLKE